MVSALSRKLLRDLARLWSQAAAIALVLACGVAILLMSLGMFQALETTREAYYDRQRFADVFARATRAPRALMPEIAALPGVVAAEARVAGLVTLDLAGRSRPGMGQVLSLPAAGGSPRLNVPILATGRLPDPEARDEVLVNAAFAKANGLGPGDRLVANLNGRKRGLAITGTALSPEFVYTLGPGALMPDNAGYGILWLPDRAAAAAFDLQGAFNDISLSLAGGADANAVIDALDRLLAPYGGTGAHGRDQQLSDAFVTAEIQQLKAMAWILPPVFFGISAFLVHMVLGRIVALERPVIGLLKALGYSNLAVAGHYLMLAALTAAAGILLGWAVGTWLSRALAELYAQFFDFPYLVWRAQPGPYAVAGLLGLAAASAGALQAAIAAGRLPPAEAMRPPAPPRYGRTLSDRLLAGAGLGQPAMMVWRGILRWPLRSGLTMLGLALAVAVMVAANFLDDALDKLIDIAFTQAARQDAALILGQEAAGIAVEEVRALPGVLIAEGQTSQPAILRHGPRERRIGIEARPPGADLARTVDSEGRPVALPPRGVLLSSRLAERLEARPGDVIEAEFLTGRRETHGLPVAGIVEQYFGLGAYMQADALAALRREAPRVGAVNVALDPAAQADFDAALKDIPALAGTVMLTQVRRSFEDTIAENVVIMNTIYITVAVLITFGVTYNGARIQLSERARDLASLRILGFTRGEVSGILVGESLVLAVAAQPVGWAIGGAIAGALAHGSQSDLYAVPVVLKPATFAAASLLVLAAAAGSALVVRRRLDQLDLVSVLKTRE